MKDFNQPASDDVIDKTKKALEQNGFTVLIAASKEEARNMVQNLIPTGSQVMENTSKTLNDIGITKEINESGKYFSIHEQVLHMDRTKKGKRIMEMRSVTDYALGSFHAVTLDGKIMMASGSGSQIPGYAYGAERVIFVAGSQKIVSDINEGFDRIYNHSLPLESERINKIYNTTDGSNPRRILILNSEKDRTRTTVILVKEALGF